MKRRLAKLLVTTLIVAQAYAGDLILDKGKRFGGLRGLIIVFDISGLNNRNNNSNLADRNIAQYHKLINRRTLHKMRVSSLEYITFNEQINRIDFIESNRAGKLYRESKLAMEKINMELETDSTKKSKDVIALFNFVTMLVQQNYSHYEQVGVLVLSNLRDTMHTKEQMTNLKPIIFDKKIILKILAASGLNSVASSSQLLNAEQNVINYFKSKITIDFDIQTIY